MKPWWIISETPTTNESETPTTNENGTHTEEKLWCCHSMDLGIIDSIIYEAALLGGQTIEAVHCNKRKEHN